jgi:hypothetical protein
MSHRTAIGHRAPTSKFGRNKWKCDKYASENRRAKNAVRKAERLRRNLINAATSRLQRELAALSA